MARWLFLFVLTIVPAARGDDGPKRARSFREDVAPILARSCLGCHSDKKAENGLNITTFALMKKGGKTTGVDILAPGDPDASEIVASVLADASPRMPYKKPPLSEAEIQTLREWVAEGARFDGPSETDTPLASLVDPLRGLAKIPPKAKVADPVTAVAISADGHLIAAAAGSRVLLIESASGKITAALDGHSGPLTSVLFTPDQVSILAAGGRAGMFGAVIAWDLKTKALRSEIREHSDAILGLDFSSDGKTFATASYDRLVKVWEWPLTKVARTLKDHTDAVHAVRFSPDGQTLATAGADRTVKLWEVSTGRRLATLSDSTGELETLAFSRDGSIVWAGGVDRSIRAWRVADAERPLVNSAFAHDANILGLAVSPDGETLASAGEDRAVKLWDARSLTPQFAFPSQPDWPYSLAFSADGSRLVVGRHDGTIGILDLNKRETLLEVATVESSKPEPTKPKPELSRNPTLNPPAPRGVTRGTTARVTLTGVGVGQTVEIVFDEPGLTAKRVELEKPEPSRIDMEVTAAPDARLGLHRVTVVTPTGVPVPQALLVEAAAAVPEIEPNDRASSLKPTELPSILTGSIEKPGDVDLFSFEVQPAQPLRFEVWAKSLGSALTVQLSLIDEEGRLIAEAGLGEGIRDPILTALAPRAGRVFLKVADADYGGSGNHFYRIAASSAPAVEPLLSLAVAPGQLHRLRTISGAEMDPPPVAPGSAPGSILEARLPGFADAAPRDVPRVVVSDGPILLESDSSHVTTPLDIPVPGGVSGRISQPGEVDTYRFEARKGQRLILEVYGRRLGTAIDSVIEILDGEGRPVPRAVLRPVAETQVAFRDHGAAGTGIRLTRWNNLATNDMVLIGRELTKILALPRNLDDDCQFWAEQGRRMGFLDTTPEHHPMSQVIEKVEIHPPGTTFPSGGKPSTTLYYRNDDGGPSLDGDSRLTFDSPADGVYLVRVRDGRGLGGPDHGYHLMVRPPRPDFQLSVSPEDPIIPRGGAALVTVTAARIDGFDGPIDVSAIGLPPGVKAIPTRIEAGLPTALLALSADATAPAFSESTWRVVGSADGPDGTLRHEVDPGGLSRGRVTVRSTDDLKVATEADSVVIKPGGEATLRLAVERGPAFKGRVPIEVRNLPHGVRVLNIGLNGVLITEKESARTITLYAEPWVQAMERPFFAVGKVEGAGTESSSPPVNLQVQP